MIDENDIKVTSDFDASITIKGVTDYGKEYEIPTDALKPEKSIWFSASGHCAANSIKITVGGFELKGLIDFDKLPDMSQEGYEEMLVDVWQVVPEELK